MTFTRVPDIFFKEFKSIITENNIDPDFYVFKEKMYNALTSHYNYFYRRQSHLRDEKYYLNYEIYFYLLSPSFSSLFNWEEEKFPNSKRYLANSLFPDLPLLNTRDDKLKIILKGQYEMPQHSQVNYLTYENILRINDYLQTSLILKKDYVIPLISAHNHSKFWGEEGLRKNVENKIWSIGESEWHYFKYNERILPEIYKELVLLRKFYNECAKFKNCWVLISWS